MKVWQSHGLFVVSMTFFITSFCYSLNDEDLSFRKRGNVYTSVEHVIDILHLEEELATLLEKYIVYEEIYLNETKDNANRLNGLIESPVPLEHPLWQLKLVKVNSFIRDNFDVYNNQSETSKVLETISKLRQLFPAHSDLVGSAQALLRLQNVYDLSTLDIASGAFAKTANGPKLSSMDVQDIGVTAHDSQKWKLAAEWFEHGASQIDNMTMEKITYLDHIAHARYMYGDIAGAVEMINTILKHLPEDQQAMENLKHFQSTLDSEFFEETRNHLVAKAQEVHMMRDVGMEIIADRYRKLCRGETVPSYQGGLYTYGDARKPEAMPVRLREISRSVFQRKDRTNTHEQNSRFCDFTTQGGDPRLILCPLKREIVFSDPWLILYHDALAEHQLEEIKSMSRDYLEDSSTFAPTSEEEEDPKLMDVLNFRVSKTAWIKYENLSSSLISRIAAVSQMNLRSAEAMQVVNYGIGGHYEAHYDFAKDMQSLNTFQGGNRLSTTIFYLGSVTRGGATVFPDLGVSVPAERGAAAFWFNLDSAGRPDFSLLHAGCPQLIGNKWIANVWVHEDGHELWYPCKAETRPDPATHDSMVSETEREREDWASEGQRLSTKDLDSEVSSQRIRERITFKAGMGL